jgi:hypothetical protein
MPHNRSAAAASIAQRERRKAAMVALLVDPDIRAGIVELCQRGDRATGRCRGTST